jgi:hypothetical protein
MVPVEHHAAQETPVGVCDRPLGSDIRGDVLGVGSVFVGQILVVRVITLGAVIAVAQLDEHRLAQVILEVDPEGVRVIRGIATGQGEGQEKGEQGDRRGIYLSR